MQFIDRLSQIDEKRRRQWENNTMGDIHISKNVQFLQPAIFLIVRLQEVLKFHF